jgi:response regulator NasT
MGTQDLRIVVAEDEPEMRNYLQELLQRQSHKVFAVANGRQLVEACRTIEPDLVIADVKMPEMDGIAAASAICHTRPTPFILVSGYHDEETLSRVQDSNIMAYLIKPVQEAGIQTAIATAMARFRQSQRVEQEVVQLRQTLEERKLIERAKGIVLKRLEINEEDAFRRMRRMASDSNRRLIEVGRQIALAEEPFRMLEQL